MEAKIQETSVSVTFGPQLPVPALSSFSATLNFFKEPLPFEFDTVNTLTIVLPVQAHNQDALATAVENLLQSCKIIVFLFSLFGPEFFLIIWVIIFIAIFCFVFL